MKSWFAVLAAGLTALAITAPAARADVTVYVGYADNLRPNPNFPNPWQGSPNVLFEGAGPTFDAGAIRFDNTGSSNITVSTLRVDGFENGASFQIWDSLLPLVIKPGQHAIFTQTSSAENFDTSDQPIHGPPGSSARPVIHVTLNGTLRTFIDSAQVLNTGGFDTGLGPGGFVNNESLQWRLIGTTGIGNPSGGLCPQVETLASIATIVNGTITSRDQATVNVGGCVTLDLMITQQSGGNPATLTDVTASPNTTFTAGGVPGVTNTTGSPVFCFTSAACGKAFPLYVIYHDPCTMTTITSTVHITVTPCSP